MVKTARMHTINAYDEQYLRAKVCIVWTPEVNDTKNRMEVHSMVEVSKSNFAEQCKRLLKYDIRAKKVESKNKYRKKECQQKMN